MKNETRLPIRINDEMLLLLTRGGTVTFKFDDILIEIKQEEDLVILRKDDYHALKIHRSDPSILENVFRKIDK